MTKESIFNNTQCVVGGSGKDVIALPVSFSGLPEQIEVQGNTFYLKSKFHISLVCINIIIKKYGIQIPDFLSKVIEDFFNFVKTNKVELIHYNNDFRFVSENELRSVVLTCEVSNINTFFDLMNEKYNLNVKYPPTHVTLYTLKDGLGIYLTDSDDIKNLTTSIENPIGMIL
jgi:hypothetical protein